MMDLFSRSPDIHSGVSEACGVHLFDVKGEREIATKA